MHYLLSVTQNFRGGPKCKLYGHENLREEKLMCFFSFSFFFEMIFCAIDDIDLSFVRPQPEITTDLGHSF